jgi:2-C-methyl-D-erythritol 2,4-cyclodiphosphate synthase
VPPIRIGQGYDTHRFAAGRRLVLGGVEIAHPRGLDGHSDADAVLHALTDALLGAVAAGDIGRHFSDRDPKNAGRDSADFVREAMRTVRARGYKVGNVDVTIHAEEPKLAPHVETMRQRIAGLLETEVDAVSIKATRGEGMGPIGRGEGIAAQAIVLLETAG